MWNRLSDIARLESPEVQIASKSMDRIMHKTAKTTFIRSGCSDILTATFRLQSRFNSNEVDNIYSGRNGNEALLVVLGQLAKGESVQFSIITEDDSVASGSKSVA